MADKPPIGKRGDGQRLIILGRGDAILEELRSGTSIRQAYQKFGDGISTHQQFHKLVTRLWWPEIEAIRKELAARKKPSSRPVGTQSIPQYGDLSLSGHNQPSLGSSDNETDIRLLGGSSLTDTKASPPTGRPYIRLGVRTREELLRVTAKDAPPLSTPKINLGELDD